MIIGIVMGANGQPYASMRWRDEPIVSAIISIVIGGVQIFSFWFARMHVERKKAWEQWKRDFEVSMLASGDQDMNV